MPYTRDWPSGYPVGPFTLNRRSPQATGLIAWWPLGPGQYGMIRDVLGRWHMTAGNTPTIVGTEQGQATSFAAASSHYLEVDSLVVATFPFTLACRFNASDVTSGHPLVFVGDKDVTDHYSAIYARGDVSGDPVRAFTHYYGTFPDVIVNTTTSYSANTWHHACGVFDSGANGMAAYLDGEGKNTGEPNTPSNHDRVAIGALRDSTPYYGGGSRAIQDVRIYNIALTDAQVLEIARKPWKLCRPVAPYVLGMAPAVAGLSIPVAMHHLRQQGIA